MSHREGDAPGTEAQKAAAAKKAAGAQHSGKGTARDTGHVGQHRARDGHETER